MNYKIAFYLLSTTLYLLILWVWPFYYASSTTHSGIHEVITAHFIMFFLLMFVTLFSYAYIKAFEE